MFKYTAIYILIINKIDTILNYLENWESIGCGIKKMAHKGAIRGAKRTTISCAI